MAQPVIILLIAQVPTTIHNIIVGKLWADQHGSMTITNHDNGDVCALKYTPYSFFTSSEAHKVSGSIKNEEGVVQANIEGMCSRYFSLSLSLSLARSHSCNCLSRLQAGTWDSAIFMVDPVSSRRYFYIN